MGLGTQAPAGDLPAWFQWRIGDGSERGGRGGKGPESGRDSQPQGFSKALTGGGGRGGRPSQTCCPRHCARPLPPPGGSDLGSGAVPRRPSCGGTCSGERVGEQECQARFVPEREGQQRGRGGSPRWPVLGVGTDTSPPLRVAGEEVEAGQVRAGAAPVFQVGRPPPGAGGRDVPSGRDGGGLG